MNALYISASHSFELRLPIPKQSECKDHDDYMSALNVWAVKQAKMPTIPCRPTDKWQEGIPYEEGRDYEVYHYSDENRVNKMEIIPVAPATEQIELWKEILNNIELDEAWKSSWQEYYISILQKQFTISRKQEVPEAVQFAEWMQKVGWERYDGPDRWINMSNGNKVLTTDQIYKEFQLFKKQKP